MNRSLGILLLGGTGSRLRPITLSVNKHLLPVYSKPMFYYSLSTLMLAGVRDIVVVCNEHDIELVIRHFGDGSCLGLSINYAIQEQPKGIPEGFLISERFGIYDRYFMALGDNILYGNGLGPVLRSMCDGDKASILTYKVNNPQDYGVVRYDGSKISEIVEKPVEFVSNDAVIGVYAMPKEVMYFCRHLKPSNRGETEISAVINNFIRTEGIEHQSLGRGFAWFDTGKPNQLLEAANFVQSLETRQQFLILAPEEVAVNLGYIEVDDHLRKLWTSNKSEYYQMLARL